MLTTIIDRFERWVGRHTHAVFGGALLVIVLIAVVLRTLHLSDITTRSPEERVYAQYAQRIALEGVGAYRELFAEYAGDPSQWIYPPPSRLLHVLSFAGVMKLTGANTAQAGAAVSWVFGIGSVLLLAAFGRRFVGRFVGLLAALLLATYVVEFEFARRAWGESTTSFLTLGLMYAACALEAEPARWRWRLAFFGVGTACLLVKETSVLAYALCGVWLCGCRLAKARDRAGAALLGLGGLVSALVAFGVLVLLSGSVSLAFDGLSHGLGSNEWGARNVSGPWYLLGQVLWLMAPLTATMAVLGVIATATRTRATRAFAGLAPEARSAASLALVLVIGFVCASAFGPNMQYLRSMAPANPSYCLLAALGVRVMLIESEDWLRGKAYPLAMAVLPVVILAVSVRDYGLYRDVVVTSGMQDLAVTWLNDGINQRDKRELAHTQNALLASPEAGTPAGAVAAPAGAYVTAKGLLDRSLRHCRLGEYAECVRTAKAALQRDPGLAEAWNNAAVGYAGLRLWDDAARHASEAVKLRPDFQLAKNNLAWVTNEYAKRTTAFAP